MQKAVIDRIVDKKHAVLLIGEEEREFVIKYDQLPNGAKEGTWLKVKLVGETLESMAIDQDETDKVKNRIEAKMALLKEKKGSQFKRN